MAGLCFRFVDSPVGRLKLVASDEGLVAITWNGDREDRVPLPEMTLGEDHPVLAETEKQLREYFDGDRREFTVPLDARGTTFQRSVWDALRGIPFGETRSYAGLARQLGSPDATRAVGAAIGRNPVSIIVPCHRVIGSSGKLTGFAGGLAAKGFLLELEAGESRLFA